MKLVHFAISTIILVALAQVYITPAYADPQALPPFTCSCTGIGDSFLCGNDAIGGDGGDIFYIVIPGDVDKYFQTNPDTGWTCDVPSAVRGEGGPLGCFCPDTCGNLGTGGDANAVDLGLTQTDVDTDYGGGQPDNRTGWICGNYRGSFIPGEEVTPISSPIPTLNWWGMLLLAVVLIPLGFLWARRV
jgi:hypothetical protein